jgi:hypothetical protein
VLTRHMMKALTAAHAHDVLASKTQPGSRMTRIARI